MWQEFESTLEQEFHSLLHEYNHVRMSEYKRNDIKSYLQYISLHRSGFKRILLEENMTEIVLKNTIEYAELEHTDLLKIVDTLLTKELDSSFALEYSHFPLLLHFHTRIPSDSLQALCLKYWKARYPSIKKSFILPLGSQLTGLNPEFKDLLSKRLQKGKLDPFDESVALCKALSIPPPGNFIDPQLSRLREMIHEAEGKHDHATEYSGCHCD